MFGQTMQYSQEELVAHGHAAASILGSEVFRRAVNEAKQGIVKEWMETTDETEQRAAWAKIHAVEAVETSLRRIQGAGEYAEASRTA